jgi:hippurate hydrolase
MNKKLHLVLLMAFVTFVSALSQPVKSDEKIKTIAENASGQYFELYKDLHKNPELSLLEFNTSEKIAAELKKLGFEVTRNIAVTGVVGILRNGPGKTIMLRTDMDALPIRENTGLPFASDVVMKDLNGINQNVMHACGHDMHMTTWLGALKVLSEMKGSWKGTLMAVAQPAEEGSMGALLMINDGLFRKFPVPDYAMCYHVSAELPAGTVGYYPGPIFAGVKSAEITVYGSGGHGAMPHTTVDPIVLASQIVIDLQTIVSRRMNPVKPAVVTVGAIHGGTKHNVIPDEVKMLLTIRFFEDAVYEKIKKSVVDITRGAAIAAGLPENKMPLVVFDDDINPPVSNNPELVNKSIASMKRIIGEPNIIQVEPATVAEDFGKYGLTEEKIPIALFWLGGVKKLNYSESILKGTRLPPLHNAAFAPDFKPAFVTGVSAMSAAAIDLFNEKTR